jgi:hypothetical protein
MVLKHFINITHISDQFVLYYYTWSESFYIIHHLKNWGHVITGHRIKHVLHWCFPHKLKTVHGVGSSQLLSSELLGCQQWQFLTDILGNCLSHLQG